MKVTVEIPGTGPKSWKQFTTQVAVSRRGNYFFKHNSKPYVFKKLTQGTIVLTLDDKNKWVVCGRISYGSARACGCSSVPISIHNSVAICCF